MQPRQQWSMFNVPAENVSKAESPFLLTTIWNYHSEKDAQGKRVQGDIAICQDRSSGSYWYCMTNATPKISRQTHVAHMRRIELAFKLHVPVIGILKDVESGKCASSQIFDCPEIRESIDGESTWIHLVPRGEVACLTREIDIDQIAKPSPIFFDGEDHTTPDQAADSAWSESELRASVAAYLDMARRLRDKQSIVKTQVYRAVAAEIGRSEKSIEYRMQNISYVLALMGRDWIQGLPPAKNVGANVATIIEHLIGDLENRPTPPMVGNAVEITKIRKVLKECPAGSATPGTTTSSTTSFVRDPKVKAWVLERAKGICEACAQSAPFSGADGSPFLEVHHLRKLADGGSDTVTNAAAVCPNCHRRLHFSEDAHAYRETIYSKAAVLIRE